MPKKRDESFFIVSIRKIEGFFQPLNKMENELFLNQSFADGADHCSENIFKKQYYAQSNVHLLFIEKNYHSY